MADEEDFLEELITERTKCNPNIPAMIEAELQRRRDARARGEDPNAEPEEDEANDADEAQERPASPHAKR